MTKDVRTTINFIPANLPVRFMKGSADMYRYASDRQSVTIHDARGREDEFTLSKNGFQYIAHTSAYIPILDPTRIKLDFYAEVAGLLKKT